MRVIAGIARSLKLKTIEGLETRPTTDRIKETLFNMINSDIPGARFLDLFSGSGAIGIEALSRGAREAVFVDNNRKCIDCINYNLDFTKLKDKAKVYNSSAESALSMIDNGGMFDIIFMDPPYDNMYEKDVLLQLDRMKLVGEDTIIIVEASKDTTFEYIEDTNLEIYKEKIYKSNKHVFIRKR